MELDMRVIGGKTSSMVKALRHGLMEPVMRGIMLKGKNTARDVSHGLMVALIQVNFMIITLKEKVK
jgi:hypothetical protein